MGIFYKKIFFILMATYTQICFSQTLGIIEDMEKIYRLALKSIYKDFQKATDISERHEIPTKSVNLIDYLSENNIAINRVDMTSDLIESSFSIKPIFLAICCGEPKIVKDFLSVIDDVNDPKLVERGGRQEYSLAHMALDPQHPLIRGVKKESRLKIIDCLGRAKADFNMKGVHDPQEANRENPPLDAGESSGHPLSEDYLISLRARALLYGANPYLKGYQFKGINTEDPKLKKLLLDYYMELYTKGKQLALGSVVIDMLKDEIKRRKHKLSKDSPAWEVLQLLKKSLNTHSGIV